jgi:Xaa-Pro aminopeptidase
MLDAMGPDAVAILVGARLVARSADTEFPFRQDSDFWYLTGFDHPDAIAILSTREGPDFSLFVQPRDPTAETWTGYRPGVEGAREDYDADEAHPCGELIAKLPSILERAKNLYHVLGRRPEVDQKLLEVQEELRTRTKLGFAPARQITDPRWTRFHSLRAAPRSCRRNLDGLSARCRRRHRRLRR